MTDAQKAQVAYCERELRDAESLEDQERIEAMLLKLGYAAGAIRKAKELL